MTASNVFDVQKSPMMQENLPKLRNSRKIDIIINNISAKRYIRLLPISRTHYMYLICSPLSYDDFKHLQSREIIDDVRNSTKNKKIRQNRHSNQQYLNYALHLTIAIFTYNSYMHLISSLSSYDDSKRLQRIEISDDVRKSTENKKITHNRHYN